MTEARVVQGRMLRIKDLTQLLGVGRSSIYRMMKIGDFPAPVRLGVHTTCWPETEVHAWLNTKAGRNIVLSTGASSSRPQAPAPSVSQPTEGPEAIGLVTVLLRALAAEAFSSQRRRGRPSKRLGSVLAEPIPGADCLPSMGMLLAENAILRRLLVDALVELECLRTGRSRARK